MPRFGSSVAFSWQTDLHCLFVICGRTIKFTRGLESFTATVVSRGVPGVYLNRVGVIRDCLINFPSRATSEAAMIESVGIQRGDLDCLSEICNRAIMVTLGLKGTAPAKIGVAVVRIDLDCLTIICDCAVDFAFSSEGGSAVIVSFGKPWVDLSITHNSCADRGAQPDIGETGQAAPHHDVPRRRIIGAREVSA